MPNAVSMKQKRQTDIYLSHSYPGFIPFVQYKKPLSASNKNTTEEQGLLGFLGDRLVKGENSLRQILLEWSILGLLYLRKDRLCGPVVRVLGYRSGGPGSIPDTARKKSSRSGTGSTQPREYN
jgi:hypothetical protein